MRFCCKTPLLTTDLFGTRCRHRGAKQVEFSTGEEFPFDLFAGLHPDCGGEGGGDGDVEPGVLVSRPDHLHFDGVFYLHG